MSPYINDALPPKTTLLHNHAPHIEDDPTTLPSSLDPFTVTTSTGFMPLRLPVVKLPQAFAALSDLLDDMPVVKANGAPGLLATYQLGPKVHSGCLPTLTSEIDRILASDGQPDLEIITAVFRDYSFLSSAYLLEPCWERWSTGLEGYGLGRQTLPACIAGPLVKTAKL